METQKNLTDQKSKLLLPAILVANDIIKEVMKYRRISNSHESCSKTPCQRCLAPHLAKVVYAVLRNQPIIFALPAFPGKSPNLAKVLGPLPDMAERCSLEFLGKLCDQIREIYSPGAKIILCSDGRVFSDAVGMRDEDVTAYQHEIASMIKELSLECISIYNLDQLYSGIDFDQMRKNLIENYGESIDAIQKQVRFSNQELNHLYCGITRFLVEDAMHPGQRKSRSAIQKECRVRAYEVIRKSGAWSRLIEDQLPHAVRLSIHPQGCGSQKLGLQLMGTTGWMTPWHGVAVKKDGQFLLMKRNDAEKLGATLIHKNSRPSHYELTEELNIGAINEL